MQGEVHILTMAKITKTKPKINARKKGHEYERQVMHEFRELGFTECLTSRNESKRMDDLGVDLMHTGPWQVQLKAVERLGNLHKVLKAMPAVTGKLNLVFHKRSRQGDTVTMRKEDFYALVKLLPKDPRQFKSLLDELG